MPGTTNDSRNPWGTGGAAPASRGRGTCRGSPPSRGRAMGPRPGTDRRSRRPSRRSARTPRRCASEDRMPCAPPHRCTRPGRGRSHRRCRSVARASCRTSPSGRRSPSHSPRCSTSWPMRASSRGVRKAYARPVTPPPGFTCQWSTVMPSGPRTRCAYRQRPSGVARSRASATSSELASLYSQREPGRRQRTPDHVLDQVGLVEPGREAARHRQQLLQGHRPDLGPGGLRHEVADGRLEPGQQAIRDGRPDEQPEDALRGRVQVARLVGRGAVEVLLDDEPSVARRSAGSAGSGPVRPPRALPPAARRPGRRPTERRSASRRRARRGRRRSRARTLLPRPGGR